jgi:hypothetical protein
LGGGALFGFGAMMFLTRGRKNGHGDAASAAPSHDGARDRVDRPEERSERKPAKPSKSARFATGAAMRILKTAGRMWLIEHLSNQMSEEPAPDAGPSDHDIAAEHAA